MTPDTFIGREKHENRFTFVRVDLRSGRALTGHSHLDGLVASLCWDVENGKKVSFTQSPNKVNAAHTLFGGEYTTLTPEQFKELEKSYEAIKDMKLYPNPFVSPL